MKYLRPDTVCFCLNKPNSLAAMEVDLSPSAIRSFLKNLPLNNDCKNETRKKYGNK